MKVSKNNEKILFISTIALLVMVGISFDYNINRGLFKVNDLNPSFDIKEAITEQMAPPRSIDFTPIGLAIFIILFIILIKEKIINFKKIQKSIKKNFLMSSRKIKKLHKKGYRLPKINVDIIVKKITKRYKRFMQNLKKELKKAKEVLFDPYKEEFKDPLIALGFVIIILFMSIFAITPSFNYGIFKEKTVTIAVETVKNTSEMFSPEPFMNIWSLIMGIFIIFIISVLKLRKEK